MIWKKKISYYRDHELEARRIVERGRERVLARHTYFHRLEKLVDLVREIRNTSGFESACRKALNGSIKTDLAPFLKALHPADEKGMALEALL